MLRLLSWIISSACLVFILALMASSLLMEHYGHKQESIAQIMTNFASYIDKAFNKNQDTDYDNSFGFGDDLDVTQDRYVNLDFLKQYKSYVENHGNADFYTENQKLAQLTRSLTTKIGQVDPKEKRVALVIGNADYKQVPQLSNPVNDAKKVTEVLKKLNFKVTYIENLTRLEMQEELRKFTESIPSDAVAFFYFAGHGVQVNGINFLIPVDARMRRFDNLDYDVIGLNIIVQLMENSPSRLNILVLDSCRDNPWRDMVLSSFRPLGESRSMPRTLFQRSLNNSEGTIIAFATAENDVASDGDGPHSPYTEALLKWLQVPNIEIGAMFRKIREDVKIKTNSSQIPWESGSITGEFYFSKTKNIQLVSNETPVRMSSIPSRPSTALVERPIRDRIKREKEAEEEQKKNDEEDQYWESIQKIRSRKILKEALEEYLKKYPEGKYKDIAKLQLKDLEQPESASGQSGNQPGQTGNNSSQNQGNGTSSGQNQGNGNGNIAGNGNNTSGSNGSNNDQKSTPAGPAEPEVLAKVDRQIPADLRLRIQKSLALLGFYKGAITGNFGPETHGAIFAFQNSKKFSPTGYLKPKEMVVLFADAATFRRANPDAEGKLNRENAPTWYVATTPEGELGYVYGVLGDPENTKVEGGDDESKVPAVTDEGGIKLVTVAKSAEEGQSSAMKVILARPDLKSWATKPPPAPGPAGTIPSRISFSALIYKFPAKYSDEIGYVTPGGWVRISGSVTGSDWHQVKAPDGSVGYIEAYALSAPPRKVHTKPTQLFGR